VYGWRAKIGHIAVSNDLVMECDFWRMAPPGVAIYVARMFYDDNLPDPLERLARMAPYARRAAEDLGTLFPDAIVYGCTSGSFFRGEAWDREYMAELSQLAGGVPVVSTARASAEAMLALGIRRVSVATPYTDDVNALLPPFLKDFGIEVVQMKGAQLLSAMDIAHMRQEDVARLSREVTAHGSDGLFFSCTAAPILEMITALEEDLGVPVVTANQASFWAVLRRAGVRARVPGFGHLFELDAPPSVPARELVTA